jgi:hypothetical protein
MFADAFAPLCRAQSKHLNPLETTMNHSWRFALAPVLAAATAALTGHASALAAAPAVSHVPAAWVTPVKAVRHTHHTVVQTKTVRRVVRHHSTSTSSSTSRPVKPAAQ